MYFVVYQKCWFRYPAHVRFRKITIIGVGLLGGSIGLAVKRRRLAREVAGFVRRRASLKDCEKAGAVDFATTDLLMAVSGADLVILCTPLSQMRSRVVQMLPALKRGAIVTDVGGMGEVVRLAKAGFAVPVTDPAEMAAAILRLARSDAEREQFSINAREAFHSRFTLATMVDAYMDLYLNPRRNSRAANEIRSVSS